MWAQVYDPLGNSVLSTIAAAIPVITLLALIASGKVKAHWAGLIALAVALCIASLIFTMPWGLSIRASLFGAAIGFFPIGWIILNVIFLTASPWRRVGSRLCSIRSGASRLTVGCSSC